MTPLRVGPGEVFHRFHGPQWASLPLSGAGAARNGGRFNRPGVEALDLAREVDTALAEYLQGASITPPGTLVAYRLDVPDIVDFSDGYDAALWPPVWEGAGCDWKYIARIERGDSPSWRIADMLLAAGHRGLLYPSYRRPGGTNLVLFTASLDASCRVEPYDPHGQLLRDRSSWPP